MWESVDVDIGWQIDSGAIYPFKNADDFIIRAVASHPQRLVVCWRRYALGIENSQAATNPLAERPLRIQSTADRQ